jgi:hypothetical protein
MAKILYLGTARSVLGAVQPVAMPALKEMLDELVAQRVPIYV